MFLVGLVLGGIGGIVFGYKVGKWTGQRLQLPSKPKPLTFEEMIAQAMQMPSGDIDLAKDVDRSIELQLKDI